jgi:hypothetical protein
MSLLGLFLNSSIFAGCNCVVIYSFAQSFASLLAKAICFAGFLPFLPLVPTLRSIDIFYLLVGNLSTSR